MISGVDKMENKKIIKSLKFIKMKEILHPLLLKVMASKTTGPLLINGILPKISSYLIVSNHVCIEDIPTLGQTIEKHFLLLVSDEDKKTIDGVALAANGVEWVHRTDKSSRINASKNIVSILKKKKKFAMYPEATWNLSPNQLILPMNYGCIRIALEADVPILPVVTLFANNKRYTSIGEIFYPSENLTESINKLRDKMSTLIYNEIEKYYKCNYDNKTILKDNSFGEDYYYEKRSSIKKYYWEEYVDDKYEKYNRAKKDKNGVREFESQFIFVPKTDEYEFFQIFNSIIKNSESDLVVNRISSEKNGYMSTSFGEYESNHHFGYGYNEKVLKKSLNNNN